MISLFNHIDLDNFPNKIREENKKYNNIYNFICVDPFPWDLRDNVIYLRYYNGHRGKSMVSVNLPIFENGICVDYTELEEMSYAIYLMSLKENRYLKRWEKIHYINEDIKDDSIENLEIIRYSKYPIGKKPFQDYHIGKEFKKQNKSIHISLYHIKDRSKDANISLSKYRYELKLGRKLEDNELLVYKDRNHLNDDINNLTHKELKDAKYPFENYREGEMHIHKKTKRVGINLLHKTDSKLNKTMNYSRYKKQIIEGRIFEPWEEVDHIDENFRNDNDDNLQVLTTGEHRKKSSQEKAKMAPKVITCCDGCNEEFERLLCFIRGKINRKVNKSNNYFCSPECRYKYMREGNKIEYKKLIKYKCTSSGKIFWIPENGKLLPSKFNPDALPFYDSYAVLDWIKQKTESKS